MSKNKRKLMGAVVLWLVISAVLLVSLLWEQQINRQLGLVDYKTQQGSTENVVMGTDAELEIHFVDVGQGDATILRLPDSRIMLIDAGPQSGKTALLNYIDAKIRRNDAKITYFDMVLLTHAHEDHCGGMPDVLAQYPADTFYRPNVLSTNNGYSDPDTANITSKTVQSSVIYRRTIEEVHNDSVRSTNVVTINQSFRIESQSSDPARQYSIDVFYSNTGDDKTNKNQNNFSPIITVEYQGKRIVMSGDAEREVEQEYVAYMQERTDTSTYFADIIKLGHHGSSTSTTAEYLRLLTTPATASDVRIVILVGEGNSYNHPTQSTLDRLNSFNIAETNILRSDINGDIVFSVRFDPASAAFQLFFGANVVLVEDTPYVATWREIVIALIVICFAWLMLPNLKSAFSASTKSTSRPKKSPTRKKKRS